MNTNKTPILKDFEMNIKIKLAALWTAVTFCYLYGDYFELYTPDKVERLISGKNALESPMALFMASIIMTIPPLMIFLSLVLKPLINKWLNLIFGFLFTIMMVMIAVESLIKPWYLFYVFLAVVESILTSIIVWNAFKWPKQID